MYFSLLFVKFRAINIVVYYYESEAEYIDSFTQICDSKSRVHCIFTKVSDPVPINKLKNIGIDAVITTHFVFAESNLVPTSLFLFKLIII